LSVRRKDNEENNMKRINIYIAHLLCLILIISGFMSRQSGQPTWPNPHSSGADGSDTATQADLPEPSTVELAGQTDAGIRSLSGIERSQVSQSFNQQPLRFEANLGQTDAEVKFLARGPGFSLFLTSTEAVLSLRKDEGGEVADEKGSPASSALLQRHPRRTSQTSLRMRLLGANRAAGVSGQGQLPMPTRTNYFIGRDRKQWRTNVPTYTSVRYSEVYPGIDLIYYGNGQQLEYDFVIAPGASPQAIALSFAGAEHITVDAGGDLVLRTAAGEVRQQKPVIYQDRDGKRQSVTGGYVLKDGEEVSFQVGSYDASLPLVIDPTIVYDRLVGGFTGDEIGYGIATDRQGNAYLAGFTSSTDFPTTPGAFQSSLGNHLPAGFSPPSFGDAFIAKLDPRGNIVYSTYLGGNASDYANGIAVSDTGFAYVAGFADSTNFPVVNGMNPAVNGSFVAKLDPNGGIVYSSLIDAGGTWGTFLGQSFDGTGLFGREIGGAGIGLDAAGNVYVAGRTLNMGNNIPSFFVMRINANGGSIGYTTFLADKSPVNITADRAGNAYVTGYTITASSIDNVFVNKLSPSGGVTFSGEFGGNEDDVGYGIAADNEGNTYVTGYTRSANFPTVNALQRTYGGNSDAFVFKLDAAGATVYSTYLGGSEVDIGYAITVSADTPYLIGWTRSSNFPTKDAFQPTKKGNLLSEDMFVTRLLPDGGLLFSSYFGSFFPEYGFAITKDRYGSNIFLTGIAFIADNGGGRSMGLPHAAQLTKINIGDTDADSLPDEWEEEGITVDSAGNITVGNTGNGEFIDLPAMGANPLHKDIFVHADWMDPLRPRDSAIRRVVEAFDRAPVMNPDRRKGIHLHVDLGPNSLMDNVKKLTWGELSKAGSVPSVFEIGSSSMGPYNWTQAEGYKGLRFDQARRARVFRYCLFANKLTGSPFSGIARGIPSTDFLVTLGLGVNTPVGGTKLQQAGTFMHELGHTLGLRHGGGDDIRYKPNYLSVMNYLFQFPNLFKNDLSRELNYSVRRLPTLDEAALGEAVGIQDPENHHTGWRFPSSSSCSGDSNYFRRLTYPALDWDCSNSLTASTVNVDLRFDMDFPHSTVTKLEGFADWPAVRFDGGGSIGQAGAVPPSPMTTENNEVDVDTLLSLTPQPLRDAESMAPIDDVTYGPLSGDFPLDVTFDGSASTDSDGGTIVSYAWDFGDGSTGIGAVVTHTYTQPGLYYATLKVTDNEGNINLVPLQNRVEVKPVCAYTISTTSQSFAVAGGNNTVVVNAVDDCPWTAASSDSWITILSGGDGDGDGLVTYKVAGNTTSTPRTGTLSVAGQTVTITQGGCAYDVSPTEHPFGGSGGTGTVDVTTDGTCQWSAVSNDDWITLGGGGGVGKATSASEVGSSSITFTVAANTTSGSRTGTLTVAGQTVTVHQSGPTADCSFTLSPATLTLPANGSSGSFLVQTLDGCSWTATPGAVWISLSSGLSGTGLGAVSYEIAPNPDPTPRSATITVADKIFTVRQGGKFNDVPVGHLFYEQIGKLSARGITLGCGNGNFCPDSSVTREQMAAFIIRALGEFNPPQPASQRFTDVPASSLFYSFIEQMAVRQITVGCGSGNYCPTSVVTREQMAAFIIRALHEAGYEPAVPAGQRFLDVALTSPFARHIEEMAVRGITVGCGGGNYCPQATVTRGQMAAFLVRAFGL
jgi:PKD domain-containing protein/all-beta uncharacterized protein/beta-propeller repeat-containing protein/S-layer family protein